MTKRYDLIVVGAGPAGLMAARTAAENGLSVALLERKTDIPKIRRLDGGAIGINEYLFGQMTVFNPKAKRFSFPTSGFSVPYDGPCNNIYGFQLHSPGGKCLRFGDWEAAGTQGDEVRVGLSMDKGVLLQGLLDECTQCGVEVFPGTNVTAVNKDDGYVSLTGNGQPFEGTFVIAADGVNSRIARIMGFNKERRFKGTARYVTWIVEGDIPADPGSFNFIITEKGIFSIYPDYKQHVFHVNTFSTDTQLDLNASIKYFMTEDPTYASWFKKVNKIDDISCVVNLLSPIKDPFLDNILLIGDAAWVMEFSNMAALCNGWKAGNAVTLAIVDKLYDKTGLGDYFEWWEKSFYDPFGKFDFGMGAGEPQDYLTGEEIDYLADLVKEPLPATMNFFTLFNLIGTTYAELIPVIEQERPAVMERLLAMRANMEEFREKRIKVGFPNR
jgi:flavin-dependent dehydrogenase